MADVDVFQTWQMLLGSAPTASQHSAFPNGSSFPARAAARAHPPPDVAGDVPRRRTLEALTETERGSGAWWGRTSRVQAGWRLARRPGPGG